MGKKSQNMWVLKYLRTHKHGLTSMRAFLSGITRLSARIYDLRKKGYLIMTITEGNSFTIGTHARYVLIKDEPNLFI